MSARSRAEGEDPRRVEGASTEREVIVCRSEIIRSEYLSPNAAQLSFDVRLGQGWRGSALGEGLMGYQREPSSINLATHRQR